MKTLLLAATSSILTASAIFATAQYLYGGNISLNIHDTIEPKSAEIIKSKLINTERGDTIKIHIESTGGYVVSKYKIQYYMQGRKTVCLVDSHAYSAAANIFMSCTEKYITPNARLLFHVSQIRLPGQPQKASSPIFYPEAYYDSLNELSKFKQYFTEEEFEKLKQGKDVMIKGSEMMKRLAKGDAK